MKENLDFELNYLKGIRRYNARKDVVLMVREFSVVKDGEWDETFSGMRPQNYKKKDRKFLRYRLEDEVHKLANNTDGLGDAIDAKDGEHYFVTCAVKKGSKKFEAIKKLEFEEVPFGIFKKGE